VSLGRSFALAPDEVDELLAQPDDAAREDWLLELEEGDAPYLDYDKAWDALQRCLGDGELVIPDDGPPLAYAVFGSRPLMEHEETDTFAGLLAADEVPAVADAVEAVDERWLRARFATLTDTDYDGPADEDDFTYTWDTLAELRVFLRRSAGSGAAIVFTVSG
jgi:Domain of unknown function (DUF1877)